MDDIFENRQISGTLDGAILIFITAFSAFLGQLIAILIGKYNLSNKKLSWKKVKTAENHV